MKVARVVSGMVLSVILAVGCDEPVPGSDGTALGLPPGATPKVGAQCTVQFRRDLLGAGRELPVPPTTDSINGAEVSLSGRFLRMDDEWIVVGRTEGEQIWVPREVVLLLRVTSP